MQGALFVKFKMIDAVNDGIHTKVNFIWQNLLSSTLTQGLKKKDSVIKYDNVTISSITLFQVDRLPKHSWHPVNAIMY